MKKISIMILIAVALTASSAGAGFLDQLLKGFTEGSQNRLDEKTIVKGLKEALFQGTEKAVDRVGTLDGYFDNAAIKIPIPENIRTVADTLSKFGFQQQVYDFELSMNRAAEKAAPRAKALFIRAIREITIKDAHAILKGDDTAATDYFSGKMNDDLYAAFKPGVSDSMDKVGVTKAYKQMVAKAAAMPFLDVESLDLDHYVTQKSLEGLFYMVGQEEKKIRADPAARTTELLRDVFGSL